MIGVSNHAAWGPGDLSWFIGWVARVISIRYNYATLSAYVDNVDGGDARF
jgi:hypothetical protein